MGLNLRCGHLDGGALALHAPGAGDGEGGLPFAGVVVDVAGARLRAGVVGGAVV